MGNGILGIRAFNDDQQTLKAISVTTSDPSSVLTDSPISLPFQLDPNVGLLLTWTGPGPDTGPCFPLAAISMELEYCCSDGVSVFETYDITQILTNAAT